MSYKMTREEREAFLADLHVGVIGIEAPGRAPVVAVFIAERYLARL